MEKNTEYLKTTKSGRTKIKIIESFFCLIEQKKWDKISIKEICAQSEISRGTFYQYYSDIYDLMESQEEALLQDFSERYEKIYYPPYSALPVEQFIHKYDYTPPAMLMLWLEFCRDHRRAMRALLDRRNGDPYFIRRLENILIKYINVMMDCDGQPRDSLRSHFVKLFLDMHFLTAQAWMEKEADNFLSIEEAVELLNTMRVGACYLSFKERSDPDFYERMALPARKEPPCP